MSSSPASTAAVPPAKALADALSITVEDLRRREDDISVSDVTSLNTLVISDEETTVERLDTIATTDMRLDPEHAATASEAKDRFRSAFERLPRRGAGRCPALRQEPHPARDRRDPRRLGSRVCQIHSQLKRTLKQQLADDAVLFSAVG